VHTTRRHSPGDRRKASSGVSSPDSPRVEGTLQYHRGCAHPRAPVCCAVPWTYLSFVHLRDLSGGCCTVYSQCAVVVYLFVEGANLGRIGLGVRGWRHPTSAFPQLALVLSTHLDVLFARLDALVYRLCTALEEALVGTLHRNGAPRGLVASLLSFIAAARHRVHPACNNPTPDGKHPPCGCPSLTSSVILIFSAGLREARFCLSAS